MRYFSSEVYMWYQGGDTEVLHSLLQPLNGDLAYSSAVLNLGGGIGTGR